MGVLGVAMLATLVLSGQEGLAEKKATTLENRLKRLEKPVMRGDQPRQRKQKVRRS